MAKRRGLGKGLDALIPSGQGKAGPGEAVTRLSVDVIERNPRQPRTNFDPQEMSELAGSIREHGVLQPLIVAKPEGDERYVLIAGERRLQAARQAGLDTVPVIVRQATEEQLILLAMIENLQREDLNPVEAAEGYRQLAEDFDLSHEAIAARVGKSRSAVTNTLRLLNLPDQARRALEAEQISEGHARALLSLPNQEAQLAALETLIRRGLNVRQTEELVRRLSGKRRTPRKPRQTSAEDKALQEEIRSAMGTRVSIKRGKKGGTLTLHFYSDEELETIVDRLLSQGK